MTRPELKFARTFSVIALLSLLGLGGCASPTSTDTGAMMDRARWTVQTFRQSDEAYMSLFQSMLDNAAGVAIFPGVVKGSFIFGAEVGNGLLIARDPGGGWGNPAFYTLGAGSFGFQAGGQVSELILVIRTRGAVESLIKHQGKLGADLEVTFGTIGAGVEGAVTTNLGADIVVFAKSAGLYGGISLEGAMLIRRNDMNEAQYGSGVTPESIVLEGGQKIPVADGLRKALGNQ